MIYDVLIVGSGPAGLSAAIYTSRAGLSTYIIGGMEEGGLVGTAGRIDNYLGMPSMNGVMMVENFVEHAQQFGAELNDDMLTVTSIDKDEEKNVFITTVDTGDTFTSKTVIFTAGSSPRKLQIEGEDMDGVSYCATCDGTFFEDEPVVLIGGGETSAEEALYMSYLADKVTVLIRGDEWRASEPAVESLLQQDNVEVRMNTSVEEIQGNGRVDSVLLNNGEKLDTRGVFVAIGQLPNSETAKPHTTVFEDGFIARSNVEGFYVAGDIANPDHRQIIVAAGDGAKVGIDVTRFLQ